MAGVESSIERNQGTKVPWNFRPRGNESSRGRKFQGTRNFRSRGRKFHPMELSSPGTKVPGDESSWYPKYYWNWTIYQESFSSHLFCLVFDKPVSVILWAPVEGKRVNGEPELANKTTHHSQLVHIIQNRWQRHFLVRVKFHGHYSIFNVTLVYSHHRSDHRALFQCDARGSVFRDTLTLLPHRVATSSLQKTDNGAGGEVHHPTILGLG